MSIWRFSMVDFQVKPDRVPRKIDALEPYEVLAPGYLVSQWKRRVALPFADAFDFQSRGISVAIHAT